MAVLTFKSPEFNTFPPVLKEYASYTAMIKGNSEKTVCEYLLDLRTFFRFYIANKNGNQYSPDEFEKIEIRSITEDDVRAVTSTLIIDFLMYTGFQRNNNTSTRMRKLCALKSFYKYAYSRKHIVDSNPTVDIDAPKKSKTLPKYMSVDESVHFLETIRSDITSKTMVRDFAIASLFLNTGMRLSELVGLNLNSFDSDITRVVVRGKGDKERVIYLNAAARRAVIDYLKVRLDPKHIVTSDKAFFLSKRQQRISNKTVQWMINKYLDLAGLGGRGLSVHKLRHTAATLMYQSGRVDIRVLKDILGHEQLNTTQIYTHVVDRNMEDAMTNNPLSDIKIVAKLPYDIDDE